MKKLAFGKKLPMNKDDIKIIDNYLSDKECNEIINIINCLDKDKKLKFFNANTEVLVAPETEKSNNYLSKITETLKTLFLDNSIYLAEGFFSFWRTGAWAGLHQDNHEGYENLKYSSIIYLNDNYKGGEIQFPELNFSYKAKKGDGIFFPCTEPEHKHLVTKVTQGTRYTIASWYFSASQQ